jgi:hypothetical protein
LNSNQLYFYIEWQLVHVQHVATNKRRITTRNEGIIVH